VCQHSATDGKGTFKVEFNISHLYTSTYECVKTDVVTLSGNYPYGNVGKPSSLGASPAIQKPGGSLTVTWSKAANGTNNNVTSYEI
jgi:hypothetical protein